jgi:hypothetical protein
MWFRSTTYLFSVRKAWKKTAKEDIETDLDALDFF